MIPDPKTEKKHPKRVLFVWNRVRKQFVKLEFGGQWPRTMRARCSALRYFPAPLGIVTAKALDKLELAYFLSGKKVITAPTIPKMVKITDHLKLKSNTGAFPKPSIKRILTKIIAIPCSCFFIQSHSFVKFLFIIF